MIVRNKSQELFQDGDLIVRPGETVEVDDSRRAELLGHFGWMFEEAQGQAQHEDEVKAQTQDYQNPVLEYRTFASVPEEDLRAESSGGDAQVEADPSSNPVLRADLNNEPSKGSKSKK